MEPMHFLPSDVDQAVLIGRVWRSDVQGPSVVTLRDGNVFDITSQDIPTVCALMEKDDVASYVKGLDGERLCSVEELAFGTPEAGTSKTYLLAPCDLQVIKACGVTFAQSMLERVIEEQAKGNPELAQTVRKEVTAIIGDSLSNIKAGSPNAERIKQALVAKGVWSQYLEVGIGPDAEVFTKAPVLSSVGHGQDVGLHPVSTWNNPEPEIVLAVDSRGKVKGAALGNDVNLRDVEGRSALLLGKAKDNNASCSIGPFIRLFDDTYSIDDVREADLDLKIVGQDGFILKGHSSMKKISRDPLDLVGHAWGDHHQYPDGFMLFLGTLFAPTQDRDTKGEGFTHKLGDIVHISNDRLGVLSNEVQLSTTCQRWTFGITRLIQNLAQRGLIGI